MSRAILMCCLLVLAFAQSASTQYRTPVPQEQVPVLALAPPAPVAAARLIGEHPLLRTIATVGGAFGGYILAESQSEEEDPDELATAFAGGAAGAALGGIIFSSAHPLRVILGSAIAVLPSAALATYLANSMDDEDQGDVPMIAFSIPQGLLTSALSPNRR